MNHNEHPKHAGEPPLHPADGDDADAEDTPQLVVVEANPNPWRALAWAGLVLVIAYTVHAAAGLILSIVVACLLALLLAPAVNGLARLKLPPPIGAAVVMIALIAMIGGIGVNLYQPVQQWADFGPSDLRKVDRKVRALIKPMRSVQEFTDKVASMATMEPKSKQPMVVQQQTPSLLLSHVQEALFATLTTIMLAYFLLASGDTFLRKTVRIIPRLRDKIRAVEIAREVQYEIGRYFLTIALLSTLMGIAVGSAMWMLDMPTPLLWGVLATLLNFIPYLGPIIALGIISIAALFTFDQASMILAPPAAYLALHFLEGQIAEPLVMGDRFELNPVVIFLWVLIWGWLGGAVGVLIAVPLLVAIRICASHIPALAPLSEIISHD